MGNDIPDVATPIDRLLDEIEKIPEHDGFQRWEPGFVESSNLLQQDFIGPVLQGLESFLTGLDGLKIGRTQ